MHMLYIMHFIKYSLSKLRHRCVWYNNSTYITVIQVFFLDSSAFHLFVKGVELRRLSWLYPSPGKVLPTL